VDWRMIFEHLQHKSLEEQKKASQRFQMGFADDLYSSSWSFLDYEEVPSQLNLQPAEGRSEKKQVLDSLEKFVTDFPGQELNFGRGVAAAKVKSTINTSTSQKLFTQFVQELEACSLCSPELIKGRQQVVHDLGRFYEGFEQKKDNCKILFVGDMPRSFEQPKCFAKDAGELLWKMIQAMNLTTSEFALSLVVKCAGNFLEKKEQMRDCCLNYLWQEILYFRPKVVVALGTFAASAIIGREERMASIHGQFFPKEIGEHQFQVVPLFHPEYLLVNPKMKRTAWNDMQGIMKYLES